MTTLSSADLCGHIRHFVRQICKSLEEEPQLWELVSGNCIGRKNSNLILVIAKKCCCRTPVICLGNYQIPVPLFAPLAQLQLRLAMRRFAVRKGQEELLPKP